MTLLTLFLLFSLLPFLWFSSLLFCSQCNCQVWFYMAALVLWVHLLGLVLCLTLMRWVFAAFLSDQISFPSVWDFHTWILCASTCYCEHHHCLSRLPSLPTCHRSISSLLTRLLSLASWKALSLEWSCRSRGSFCWFFCFFSSHWASSIPRRQVPSSSVYFSCPLSPPAHLHCQAPPLFMVMMELEFSMFWHSTECYSLPAIRH